MYKEPQKKILTVYIWNWSTFRHELHTSVDSFDTRKRELHPGATQNSFCPFVSGPWSFLRNGRPPSAGSLHPKNKYKFQLRRSWLLRVSRRLPREGPGDEPARVDLVPASRYFYVWACSRSGAPLWGRAVLNPVQAGPAPAAPSPPLGLRARRPLAGGWGPSPLPVASTAATVCPFAPDFEAPGRPKQGSARLGRKGLFG